MSLLQNSDPSAYREHSVQHWKDCSTWQSEFFSARQQCATCCTTHAFTPDTARVWRTGDIMISILRKLRSIVNHDGAVILDIPRNTMTTLNSTGAYIWERLDKGMSLDSIIAELASDSGADPSIVAADVSEFLETLQSEQLVSISHSSIEVPEH
jgi:hypothetical protein